MSSARPRITPNPPRWKPSADPTSIVVQGLDTDASVTDQIEQIEQLITIKLQNIDENFSKIHHALATKVLPAVKRYAVGTEPVREAAKFWTSFYEQAAQIRIPTYDDYSTVNENTSEHEDTESASQDQDDQGDSADTTARYQESHIDHEAYETSTLSAVNSETSFRPGQGAISSTPAMTRTGASRNKAVPSQGREPSWMPTESPLVRLNREINELSLDTTDNSIFTPQSVVHRNALESDTSFEPSFSQDTGALPSPNKGKGKDTSHPLLRNVLRHNLYSASDNSVFEAKNVSPLKLKTKPKTPIVDKTRNPYLPEQATPADWTGVVDLRDPNMLTPKRKGKSFNLTAATPYDDEDDSFEGLPPGMSPPVLMSPARPPRSSAELGLLRLAPTPARDATARIQRDLIRDAQVKTGDKSSLYTGKQSYYESSTSTAMTPPSFSRYSKAHDYSTDTMSKDSSLESMIRHIRDDIRPTANVAPATTTPDLPRKQVYSSAYSQESPEPTTPVYEQLHRNPDDLDSDSDSLDDDIVNSTAHPSAAFLMASQGVQYTDDNSFGSSNNSSDSLADEDVATATGIVPIHPFAQSGPVVEDDGFDDVDSDSSDDGFETQVGPIVASSEYEDETLFGLAPGNRMRLAPTGQLRMLGEDLLHDTIGIGSYIAASGRQVDESPTPNVWQPR